MRIQLSDHFTYKKLFRFVYPSIVMMIFTSIYGVVDGLFVSNFAGKTPFAACNLIWPFIMILSTPGFMLGTGGGALVAKLLGEKQKEKANELFSLFCYTAIAAGIVFAVGAYFAIPPVAKLMGAEGEMLDLAVLYGRIVLVGCVPQMLHFVFESLTVTAEKPMLGLIVTVASGVTNMVLDALFVGVFKWGLAGAAWATVASQCVGGFFPFIYFIRPNTSLLRISKAKFDGKALIKACTNGSSELMSNVSMSLIGMLYNVQLMKYLGENGVAAYGVLMYVNFVFIAAFIGYSIGTAPIIGYNFGAQNRKELKNIFKKSVIVIGVSGIIMVALGELLASPLSDIFVGMDEELFELTKHGFRIFSLSFVFAGYAIFTSSFFTALSNGLISAIVSFLRTLVFQLAAVLLLPLIVGPDGIWYSVVIAEVCAVILSAAFVIAKRKKYGYM